MLLSCSKRCIRSERPSKVFSWSDEMLLSCSKRYIRSERPWKASSSTDEMLFASRWRAVRLVVTALKAFAGTVVSRGESLILKLSSVVSPAKSPGTMLALL